MVKHLTNDEEERLTFFSCIEVQEACYANFVSKDISRKNQLTDVVVMIECTCISILNK